MALLVLHVAVQQGFASQLHYKHREVALQGDLPVGDSGHWRKETKNGGGSEDHGEENDTAGSEGRQPTEPVSLFGVVLLR
jgi:hypothetical protein